MNHTICDAIQQKTVLNLYYDGHMRVVEPYTHGVSDSGKKVLRCFQIDGGSNSGKVLGWKVLNVNEIQLLSITEREFSRARQGYRDTDTGIERIFCELQEAGL